MLDRLKDWMIHELGGYTRREHLDLEADYKSKSSTVGSLREALVRARDREFKLEEKLREADSEFEHLSSELTAAKNRNAYLTGRLDLVQGKLAIIRSELES